MIKRNYSEYASVCIITFSAFITLWLFLKYAALALLPLASALLVASGVRPIAGTLGKKSRASTKLCGGILVFIVVFATIYGLFCLGIKLTKEMTEFISVTVEGLEREDNPIRKVIDFFEGFRDKIPIFSKLDNSGNEGLSDEIYSVLIESAKRTATSLSEKVTSFAASFIKAMPDFIFSVVVFIISLFYLTMDYEGVKSGVKKLVPEVYLGRFKRICGGASGAVSGYIRAYLVLMLLTFGELFLGFAILRIKYSFFLAFIVAIIDILPVFGVGTVLIPWAVVLFINGNTGKAVGILVLFGIMYIVRQFSEPRLIGRFMGIHPLLTLSAAYLGYTFFGILGMIISPIILYITKLVISESGEMKI